MKVYSADLRKKVLSAYRDGQGSMRKLSERFAVSLTFVFRLIKGFGQNGHIRPKPPGGGRPSAISEEGLGFLIGLMREESDLTLKEFCERYGEKFHKKVSKSAMDRTLKKADVSRKKKIRTTLQKTVNASYGLQKSIPAKWEKGMHRILYSLMKQE